MEVITGVFGNGLIGVVNCIDWANFGYDLMWSYSKDMVNLLVNIISIVLLAEFILGNFASVFIAFVNCIDWVRRHKITPADRIVMSVTVTRIALLWIIYIYWDSYVVCSALYTEKVRITVVITLTVINRISIWLATTLSIFYLFKIANFSNLIYILLKRNTGMKWMKDMNEHRRIMTWKANLTCTPSLSYVTVITGVNLIPFAMSLSLLLIYSLCKHRRKMQLYSQGSQDLHSKMHVNVMKIVFSFVLLFVIYFLSVVMSVWVSNRLCSKLFLSLCWAIGFIYPSNHSFVLIWGNRKLKQAFLPMVWQLKCWLKEWKPPTL
ncbi:putative taste receptor type 2 member 33 [Ochotona princeps]|uniref:putative taste receptor type 2 member 33 n=1 Tax=Ochotona princeps TaxID=9978 RepID=UPI0027155FDF|nr:putative taste receptor type 2 member 33 [Ochotona princeps]